MEVYRHPNKHDSKGHTRSLATDAHFALITPSCGDISAFKAAWFESATDRKSTGSFSEHTPGHRTTEYSGLVAPLNQTMETTAVSHKDPENHMNTTDKKPSTEQPAKQPRATTSEEDLQTQNLFANSFPVIQDKLEGYRYFLPYELSVIFSNNISIYQAEKILIECGMPILELQEDPGHLTVGVGKGMSLFDSISLLRTIEGVQHAGPIAVNLNDDEEPETVCSPGITANDWSRR